MVQSLEQYVAEATNAYQPAKQSVQTQLDALSGQLASTNEQINRDYAQQAAALNRQKNQAAETASMQAAGSGGSFGGASNIANRKYYEQTYVPAVTQMNTNQSNALSSAAQASEDQRTSLNAQLANLDAQANQAALAQYWSDVEAEKEREATAALQAQQNAMYKYLMEAQNTSSGLYTLSGTKNIYGGYNWVDNSTGHNVRVATVAAKNASVNGGTFQQNLKEALEEATAQGDEYSAQVLNEINNGYKFESNIGGTATGNAWYDTLGIKKVYDPYTNTSTGTTARYNLSNLNII